MSDYSYDERFHRPKPFNYVVLMFRFVYLNKGVWGADDLGTDNKCHT